MSTLEAARQLISREPAETDARGFSAALTTAGLRAIQSAAPDHVASVRRHMVDLLTAEQLAALVGIADVVLDHLARLGDLPPVPSDEWPQDETVRGTSAQLPSR